MQRITMGLAAVVLMTGLFGCGKKDDSQAAIDQYRKDNPGGIAKPMEPVKNEYTDKIDEARALIQSTKPDEDAKADSPDAPLNIKDYVLRLRNERNLMAVGQSLTRYALAHDGVLPMTLGELVAAKMLPAEAVNALKLDPNAKAAGSGVKPEDRLVPGAPLVYAAAGTKMQSVKKLTEFVAAYNPTALADGTLQVLMLDGHVTTLDRAELTKRLAAQKAGK